jgi:hypothetical protein
MQQRHASVVNPRRRWRPASSICSKIASIQQLLTVHDDLCLTTTRTLAVCSCRSGAHRFLERWCSRRDPMQGQLGQATHHCGDGCFPQVLVELAGRHEVRQEVSVLRPMRGVASPSPRRRSVGRRGVLRSCFPRVFVSGRHHPEQWQVVQNELGVHHRRWQQGLGCAIKSPGRQPAGKQSKLVTLSKQHHE